MIENEIIIDNGCETFVIKTNAGEEYAKLIFNPSDPEIYTRYTKISKAIDEKEFNTDTIEGVNEVNSFLVKQMSDLLNRDTSEELFGKQSPLSILADGDFFIDKLLDIIPKIVEERTKQRFDKKIEKIKKATAKYHQ